MSLAPSRLRSPSTESAPVFILQFPGISSYIGVDSSQSGSILTLVSRRSDYIRLLQNPYAELSIEEERSPRRNYVHRLQNPYATLEVSDEVALTHGTLTTPRKDADLKEPVTSPIEAAESTKGSVFKSEKLGVSKADFETRCRHIFRQYMPLDAGRRLRPEYQEFIIDGKLRNAQRRAAILRELERYDLVLLGNVKPYLNRERESDLRAKLRSILDASDI
jgi:hypothetical protein